MTVSIESMIFSGRVKRRILFLYALFETVWFDVKGSSCKGASSLKLIFQQCGKTREFQFVVNTGTTSIKLIFFILCGEISL